MPLQDLIDRRFGVRTRAVANPGTSSLGTTVSEVLPNNPNRLAFVVFNLSANVLFLAPFRDVSTTNGLRIAANGGSVTFIADEDFNVVGWAWYGVMDAGAAQQLYVLEVVEYGPPGTP